MTATVKLWAIQPGPMDKSKIVEMAARICYRSSLSETVEGRMAFLGKLAKRGHLSVFEHSRFIRRYFNRKFGDNPYQMFWSVRYGTQITGEDGRFIVSMNARNHREFYGVNQLFAPLSDALQIPYSILTDAEKLAHASATFEIGGISRACSHQLVRHRVNSPSQESQRFVTSGNWEPVVPPSIQADPHSLDDFNWLMSKIKWTYKQFRKRGIPKQDARYVLPNATPTRLMVTGTFECWHGFLTQRLATDAQWEIRDGVAQQIHAELMALEPGLFGGLGE